MQHLLDIKVENFRNLLDIFLNFNDLLNTKVKVQRSIIDTIESEV